MFNKIKRSAEDDHDSAAKVLKTDETVTAASSHEKTPEENHVGLNSRPSGTESADMGRKKNNKNKKKSNNHYVASAAAAAAAALANGSKESSQEPEQPRTAEKEENEEREAPENVSEQDADRLDLATKPIENEEKEAPENALEQHADSLDQAIENEEKEAPENALELHADSLDQAIENEEKEALENELQLHTDNHDHLLETPEEEALKEDVIKEDVIKEDVNKDVESPCKAEEVASTKAEVEVEKKVSSQSFERMGQGDTDLALLIGDQPYCQDWVQTDNILKFNVRFSVPVTPSNISVELSPDKCLVALKDDQGVEKSWSAVFWRPIVKHATRVMCQDNDVHIQAVKEVKGERWEQLTLAKTPKPLDKTDKEDTEFDPESKTETETKTKDVDENCVDLQILKHSWYEKGQDFMVIQVFVKEILEQFLSLVFTENACCLKFKTADVGFLKTWKSANSSTRFRWSIQLRHPIEVKQSSFKVNKNSLEISLKKQKPGRWTALEASSFLAPAEKKPLIRRENLDLGEESKKVASSVEKTITVTQTKPTYSHVSHMDNSSRPGLQQQNMTCNTTSVTTTTKPTCMVSPLPASQPNKENEKILDTYNTSQYSSMEPLLSSPNLNTTVSKIDRCVSIGMTGLDNMGNTCFMNSVLQCLANTRELRDYFLKGDFQKDLNENNPLGLGGNLAIHFTVLLKILWSGNSSSYAPAKLKNLVAQKASQFTGFAQHDAQEFLAFLLDGLHEDVNRVVNKPYTTAVEPRGRPDDVVADEAWESHLKRNNSFIVDLCHGQFKSKLTCPVCQKVSVTFDPFTYLTVPLPKKQLTLPVLFMWSDPHKTPVRYLVPVSKENGTIEDVKNYVVQKNPGLSANNLKAFEVYKHRMQKIFEKGAKLDNIQPTDQIVVAEKVPQNLAPGERIVEVMVIQRTLSPLSMPTRCSFCRKDCLEGFKLKRCMKCLRVGYCDQTCQRSHWTVHKGVCRNVPEPIGMPFSLSLPESQITYPRLVYYLQSFANLSIDIFKPPSMGQKSEVPRTPDPPSNQFNFDVDQRPGIADEALDSTPTPSPRSSTTQIEDLDHLREESHEVKDDSDSEGSFGFVSGSSSSGFVSASSSVAVSPVEEPETEIDRPARIVHGVPQQQNVSQPSFFIKPVDQRGQNILGPGGERIDGPVGPNGNETLIDLSDKPFLAMDWKNNSAMEGCVMVQSRPDVACNDGDYGASAFAMRLVNSQNGLFSSTVDPYGEDSGVLNVPTLDQCLEKFTEAEVLSEDDLWYCPSCKEHRQASKQLTLWRLPKILLLHLKRFSFRNFIWRDKITKHVEFPTQGLNLSRYCPTATDEAGCVYDLYAVINHFGGILGGHYTAYGRLCDSSDTTRSEYPWRLFDDSHVTPVARESDVVTRNAYVLFYVRRDQACEAPLLPSLNNPSVTIPIGGEEEVRGEEERRNLPIRIPNLDDAEEFKLCRKGSDTSTCTEDTLLSSCGTDCDEVD